MNRTIITVIGKDRVGIIATVCTYLAEHKINILDIDQSIIQGYFHMMMIVDANGADTATINISGTCVLNENVSGELMAELVKNLPYINFKMGDGYKVTSIITFMNNEGTAVLW